MEIAWEYGLLVSFSAASELADMAALPNQGTLKPLSTFLAIAKAVNPDPVLATT